MKNFEVIKLNNSEYDYMVMATTCISPISTLTDIQNELEDKSGRIIFDLTLILMELAVIGIYQQYLRMELLIGVHLKQ